MISGLNHVTISVTDLNASLAFYTGVLGFKGRVKWESGAYLSAGETWLCLSKGEVTPSNDYSHIAWSVTPEDFASACKRLKQAGVDTWKTNTSEGNSYYFLDPNGHKMELHVGSLATRLASLRDNPYQGLEWL